MFLMSSRTPCAQDAGPGMFPYRDVSSLDKICTLTFEVNNLQVGILFLRHKPFHSLPTTKTGLPLHREATLECLESLHVHNPTYPCALAFGEQQQWRFPLPFKQCLVSPFFFYIPRKS